MGKAVIRQSFRERDILPMEFMFVIPLPVEEYDAGAKAAHPDEEQYEVIEGSHRWKVLMELGHGDMLWQVRKIKVKYKTYMFFFLTFFLIAYNPC